MTISANSSFDPSRDSIIQTAWQLCGLLDFGQTLSPAKTAGSAVLLNNIYKALQNEGVVLRTVERSTQTTTAGTASYSAPADTLWVEFPAYVTPSSGAAGTTQLIQMVRAEYMAISDKETQGTPTRMLVDETSAGVELILYPVPDTSVASFTYQRVRMLRDVDTGTVTQDLPSRYLKCVTYTLAHDIALAQSLPVQKLTYLSGIAAKEREMALGTDSEHGSIQFVPSFGGNYRGWR